MRRRDFLWLFLLSLAMRLAVAALIPQPGYMDVACYAAGAVRLAQGGGLSESFIWNYLDDPAGIPHPGFLYWMPLPSLLAVPFTALFPGSFFALQFPFAILSALLPLVAYALAWETTGRRRSAWLAGLLTLFSGFFFPYWTLPESFTPFALFSSLALWLTGRGMQDRGGLVVGSLAGLLVGLLVGLAHLTRADGILLLPIIALAPLVSLRSHTTFDVSRLTFHVSRIASVILGYLLVTTPWFLRNLSVIGAPLPPAGTKTLWLRTYDDLFCFGCDLSLRSYLAWGWGNILSSKLWAAWVNFEHFLAEDCLIFLFPFVLVGLYRLRRRSPFTLSLVYLLLLYLTHSLAFTFPGPRGSFFHASGALLPFIFPAALVGLDEVIAWVARRRRTWRVEQARAVFTAAAICLAVALSGYLAVPKLAAWRVADQSYTHAGAWLEGRAADRAIVMVGNPPGFWYHTHRPAVVIPNGGVDDLVEAVERYRVEYVLLERNCPAPLAALYAGEETSERLTVVATWEEGGERAVLYAVKR